MTLRSDIRPRTPVLASRISPNRIAYLRSAAAAGSAFQLFRAAVATVRPGS
jgi:hypothetical protein